MIYSVKRLQYLKQKKKKKGEEDYPAYLTEKRIEASLMFLAHLAYSECQMVFTAELLPCYFHDKLKNKLKPVL